MCVVSACRTVKGCWISSLEKLRENSSDRWEHGPSTLSVGVCRSK